jgi:8-oxo-dGTP diphosphatase
MAGVVCDLGVAARAIHNGKILLVKEARGNYQNLWGLPKGSVDEGESPESAVLRELSEETGVSGTIIGLSAVRSTLYKEKPAVFLCYDVNLESNQTSITTDEIDEIKWADLSELKELEWVSQTMHNLALDGLSGERMSIKSSRPISKSASYHVYSVNRHSKNKGQ